MPWGTQKSKLQRLKIYTFFSLLEQECGPWVRTKFVGAFCKKVWSWCGYNGHSLWSWTGDQEWDCGSERNLEQWEWECRACVRIQTCMGTAGHKQHIPIWIDSFSSISISNRIKSKQLEHDWKGIDLNLLFKLFITSRASKNVGHA